MCRNRSRQLFGAAFIALLLGLTLFVQEDDAALRMLDGWIAPAWGSSGGSDVIDLAWPEVNLSATSEAPYPGQVLALLVEVLSPEYEVWGTLGLELPEGLVLAGAPTLHLVCQQGPDCTGQLNTDYAASGLLVEPLILPGHSAATVVIPVRVDESVETGAGLAATTAFAFEAENFTGTVTDSVSATVGAHCNPGLEIVVASGADSGPGSLRCLIDTLPAGATITFAADFSGASAVALDAPLYLQRGVTIDGTGFNVEIDGGWDKDGDPDGSGEGTRVMVALPGAGAVTLRGVTLQGGLINRTGGTARRAGGNRGAGLLNLSAALRLEEVTLRDNYAGRFGGGVYSHGGELSLNNSTLIGNHAFRGGGLYNQAGELFVTGTTFSAHTGDEGAGLYNLGDATLTDTVFQDNTAVNWAAALYNGPEGTAAVSSTVFQGQTATWTGALLNEGDIELTDVAFSDNKASDEYSSGGAMRNRGTAVLNRVSFAGNQAGSGGALQNTGDATLTNVIFDGNTAVTEGGGYRSNGGTAMARHTTFRGNSAPAGGGVYVHSGTLELYNSVIADNAGGDCFGHLVGNISNWIADNTCTPAYTGDPKLDASGTPQADSGLIDVADPDHCSTADLHGLARPQGAGCDIGAVERAVGNVHTLTLEREGSGEGLVTADSGAIDCGPACSGSYSEGALITLSATPGEDFVFTGWSGCDSSDATQCQVTLTSDRSVTATFETIHTLTLTAVAGGTLTADPGQAEYAKGTPVTLTASPDPGHSFGGWSGACSGSDTICELVMDADLSVGARFFTGGDGSQDAPWGIGTADQLEAVRHEPGKHYRLTADIDLTDWLAEEGPGYNEGAGWEPISFFQGAFDGNGHRIRGLTIQRPDQDRVALFGAVESGGVVKNLELADGTIEGRQDVGAIVGLLSGELTGSRSTGNNVKGDSDVGGMVGRVYGGAVSRSYANDSVSGNQRIGGLAGSADPGWDGHTELLVSNTFADSNVNGEQQIGGLLGELVAGAIATSHSLGAVHGSTDVGGLVGLSGGSIDSSYWDIEGTTQATSAGGTGLTRAEMLHSTNLAGFDFSEVWRQYDGYTTPLLRNFLSPLTVTALDASGETGAPLPEFAVTYDPPESEVIDHLLGTLHFVHDAGAPPERAGSYLLTPVGLASWVYDIRFDPGTLRIGPAAPRFSYPDGDAVNQLAITLTADGTEDGTIRYTTDGSEPTREHGEAIANGATLILEESALLRAVAYLDDLPLSSVSNEAFTLTAAPPTPSLPSGSYSEAQSVALSTTTPDAAIEYSVDGGDTWVSYGEPIALELAQSVELVARTVREQWHPSAITSATYHLYPVLRLEDDAGEPLPERIEVASGAGRTFSVGGGSAPQVTAYANGQGAEGTLLDLGGGEYRFEPPTTGAFAGSYGIVVTDSVTGWSETVWVDVPLRVTASRPDLLGKGGTAEITVQGAAPGTLLSLDVLDSSEQEVKDVVASIADASAVDDEPASHPATTTLFGLDIAEDTQVRVSASAEGYPAGHSGLLTVVAAEWFSGTVTDGAVSLSGATVMADGVTDALYQPYKATTDDNGQFTLAAPKDVQRLAATGPGYAAAVTEAGHCLGESFPCTLQLSLAGMDTLSGASGTALVHSSGQSIALDLPEAPVVIAGIPSFRGSQGGVARVSNVTASGFHLRFARWEYLGGRHTREQIAWMALLPGRYHLPDGSIWEVGRVNVDGTGSFRSRSFGEPFPGTPRLFLTVQTENDNDVVTVRARNVTPEGFRAALFEQESKMDGHATESVGYLAIYNPADRGQVVLNGETVEYTLEGALINHRFREVLEGQHRISLQEEQSLDEEMSHTNEDIDLLLFGEELYGQDVSTRGRDTAALRHR